MVRAFTHCAMGRRIDPSWWTHCAISRSSQCSTSGVTGRGMCHPACGMMHIKEPLLLMGKSSPCVGSRFPIFLSEWSFTICLTPYNCKLNVLSVSLNKTFPSSITGMHLQLIFFDCPLVRLYVVQTFFFSLA